MPDPSHRTGTIQSGDVALFYRAFGNLEPGGATPLIILHGSNYFDSYDWIDVAAGVARERPVVAFDHRGFGQSEWSRDKDYSLDAILADICNVSAHFGWERPAILGHSMSGRLAIFFAAHFPERLSQLIVVDSAMGSGNPGKYQVAVGKAERVYPTVEDAMATLSSRHSPPRFALDRQRAERALRKVEGGYALTRDPDHRNTQSQAPGAPLPRLRDLDVWQSLGQVSCPVTFVRGRLSDRNKPEYYDRIARDVPHCRIETVEARHDIAHEAPADLIALLGRIVR
ncbi:MAG: alpha/beta hydrolase [Hyphomicrobiales bacterium]|nr:alpha/beta hydrolase [Hyphomicrobiales bacterium]